MVTPTTEPARMQRRVNDVVQPKNLAPLVSRSPNQVAKWARDAADVDADSTGCHGPLDMLRTYFRVLAIHGPEGRAVAVELREWLCREADEALGIVPAPANSMNTRLDAVARMLREISDAAHAASRGDIDPAEVARECAEGMEALHALSRVCTAPSTNGRGPLTAA
jgi:hypothetical protein